MANLVALRQLLQRLLAAVGSLVALSTLTTAAALEMLQQSLIAAGRGGTMPLPREFVLILGGAHSLFVAAFYVPVATALQRRGKCLRDELIPFDQADQTSAIVSAVEDRHKLEQFLGLQQGPVADLQTSLVILSPLIASAAATFLP